MIYRARILMTMKKKRRKKILKNLKQTLLDDISSEDSDDDEEEEEEEDSEEFETDLAGYKKRFHDDVRLNGAQKKELKKVGTPSRAIKYWPRNDDDGLFYVPYILDKRFTPFEEKTIRLAFKEFPKHTNIRFRDKNDSDPDWLKIMTA